MSRKKSRGLGDDIAKFAKVTGVDKVVKDVSKAIGFKDCGCERRAELLNQIVPYVNKEDKCMNEEQYLLYKNFREKYMSSGSKQFNPTHEDMMILIAVYNSVTRSNIKGCNSCNGAEYVKRLDKIYLSYEENNI